MTASPPGQVRARIQTGIGKSPPRCSPQAPGDGKTISTRPCIHDFILYSESPRKSIYRTVHNWFYRRGLPKVKKNAKLAQKLGHMIVIAVFPPECMGQSAHVWADRMPFSLELGAGKGRGVLLRRTDAAVRDVRPRRRRWPRVMLPFHAATDWHWQALIGIP